jgi:hypothetical protein
MDATTVLSRGRRLKNNHCINILRIRNFDELLDGGLGVTVIASRLLVYSIIDG